MPDNLKRRAPEDPKKINLNQPWEVEYWCTKFNITEEELEEAVDAVGVWVSDVKEYLGI